MTSGFTLFINLAPFAQLALIASFAAAFPYRKEPAAQSLLWYLILCFLLMATNALELISRTDENTILFAKLQYIAFAYLPIAWISFSFRYTGWITHTIPALIVSAILFPVILPIVVFTNDSHHLFWRTIEIISNEGYSIIRPTYGPLYWLAFGYSWSAIFIGCVVLLRSYVTGQNLYHRQSVWIAAGCLMPAAANLLRITSPLHGIVKDFTPLGYALSGISFLLGMYLHRLFWVMPVSRGVLLQQIDLGILVLDRTGLIADHNAAADRYLGLDAVAVGQKTSRYPLILGFLKEAEVSPESGVAEKTTGQIFLNERHLSWTVQPAGSEANGIIAILEDVSERVRLQTENAFIKGEFLKRAKLASIGKLTAGLAHEINNPLSYLKSDVRCLSELLDRLIKDKCPDPDSEETREVLSLANGINSGLERIEAAVRSLLSLTRQGSAETNREAVKLEDCLDSTLEIMKAEYRGIADVVKLYGETKAVRVQKAAINQVIFNILTNAVQGIREQFASIGRRGMIHVKTGTCEGDPDRIWCEIMNTGTPIQAEDSGKIFDLFFTTRSGDDGTGIGLSLSKEIIEERHGGTLKLTSLDPVIFRIELQSSREERSL